MTEDQRRLIRFALTEAGSEITTLWGGSLPADVATTPYDVAALLVRTPEAALFRAVEAPEVFLHEEPSYATWSPHIHRAPTPGA
jgi:hypothetical protein